MISVSAWGCVPRNAGVTGGKKRVSEPLDLELLALVNHLIWFQEPNLGPLEDQQVLSTTEECF